MQFLLRYSSIAGKNQFPTTDFKMRYSPRFSSTAEKFMASTNSSCDEKEDRINEKEDKINEKDDKINEKEDRISELPQNIIDHIFDRMPIGDAARTTILSRKWRHVWASHPKLVFDENFFQEILIRHEQSIQYEFTKAISKALSFHGGPIFTFILHIPNIPNIFSEIDQWMLFLSRNGIKELEINNSSPTPYTVPCCIFSCSLSNLKLRNCRLKPPHNNEFEGFQHLVSLELVRVLFCATMSATLLQNTPMLKKLAIVNCTGSQYIDWRWVANKKQLKYVRIELGMEVKNVEPTANMMEFLKDIPEVGELYLNGFSLEYLGTSNPRKCQDLSITHIMIRGLLVDQIPCLLCLLKHCPSFMSLQIEMGASGRNNKNVIESVEEYLEQSSWLDVNMEMLQTVNIRIMEGNKAELLLIKLLLRRSTCLKRMIIQQYTFRESLDISGQLLSFPRASSSSEFIYQEHSLAALESLSGDGVFIYPLCFAFIAIFLFQVLLNVF